MLQCINKLLGATEIGIARGVLACQIGLRPLPPILASFVFLRIVLIHAAHTDAVEAEIVGKLDCHSAGICGRRRNACVNHSAVNEFVEVRHESAVMDAVDERPHITVAENKEVQRKY